MGKQTYKFRFVATLGLSIVLAVTMFAGNAAFAAKSKNSDREDRRASIEERLDKIYERLCDRLTKLQDRYPWFSFELPSFCNNEEPEPEEEPTVDLSANPLNVPVNGTTTLSWNSDNADTCTASNGWSGNKAVDGSQVVTISATTTYTLACEGDGGSDSDSVTVEIIPSSTPEPLPSVDLTADPSAVLLNGTTTLNWDSTNADGCLASNGWSGAKALDGSQVVTVTATTTYTLACANETGTTTDSVMVGILPLPPAEAPTLTFTASTTSIEAGATTTLSWNSENTTSCTASNGWSGSKALDGSQNVSPSATTTYTLTCSGSGGSVAKNVTINVTQPEPLPTVDLSANPLSVLAGGTTTLSWNSDNADTCTASNGWSGSKALDDTQVVTVSATTTYTLACANSTGTSTDSVTVDITTPDPAPAPTLDFSASSTTIEFGATTTLSWNSENTTSCTASNGWSGSKALDGSQNVSPSATTTYTLTCEGDGGSVVKNVTINITEEEEPADLSDVLITEVYYDVSSTTGVETTNEWIELYNPTTSALNLSGLLIVDAASSSDTLPAGSIIPAQGFMVIIASSTTPGFWSIPGAAAIVNINSPIGNGLGNDNDAVLLKQGGTTIDGVNYGSTTVPFSPSVTDVAEGHSIARSPLSTDTNTAADWIDRTSPTPGS